MGEEGRERGGMEGGRAVSFPSRKLKRREGGREGGRREEGRAYLEEIPEDDGVHETD